MISVSLCEQFFSIAIFMINVIIIEIIMEVLLKPTDILMKEHFLILRAIHTVDLELVKLKDGKGTPVFFLDLSDFIKGYADGCHHAKEENVFFKYVKAASGPAADEPIALMLSEHAQGRIFNDRLHAAALLWQAGDTSVIHQVAQYAEEYTKFIREHISKESRIVFAMGDQFIDKDKYQEIADAFDRFEYAQPGEGAREKYLKLVEKLEKEVRFEGSSK